MSSAVRDFPADTIGGFTKDLRRADVAAVPFQFDLGDGIEWHTHFFEPTGEFVFVGGFHHADGFTLGEICETAVAFDGGIMLRGLGELLELVGGKFPGTNRMSTHVFRHDLCLSRVEKIMVTRTIARINPQIPRILDTAL